EGNRLPSVVVLQGTRVVKSRRQFRNGKVKLSWRLRDSSELAIRSRRVVPIDLESVPIGIRLSDHPRRLAKFSDARQSRAIPRYGFGGRFMRPTVKSQWRRSGKVEVEHTPNLHIRNSQMYRDNLKKEKNQIKHQRCHTIVGNLPGQTFRSRPMKARRQSRVAH